MKETVKFRVDRKIQSRYKEMPAPACYQDVISCFKSFLLLLLLFISHSHVKLMDAFYFVKQNKKIYF